MNCALLEVQNIESVFKSLKSRVVIRSFQLFLFVCCCLFVCFKKKIQTKKITKSKEPTFLLD